MDDRYGGAGGGLSAAVMRRFTAGNPFLLNALLTQLVRDEQQVDDEGAAKLVPLPVSRALRVRLDRLPADALALAHAAAVLGDGASLHLSGKLAGLQAEQSSAAAEALLATSILRAVDPVTFAAPLLAAALLDELSPVALARAHRRAADVLQQGGARLADVAGHLLLTFPARDPWISRTLSAAADEASAARDAPRAAELLARAAQEPPEASERQRVSLALAVAQAQCDEPQAIARLEAAIEQVSEPDERIRTLATLVGLYLARADFASAVALADQALSLAGPAHPSTGDLRSGRALASSFSTRCRAAVISELGALDERARGGMLELAVLAGAAACRGAPAAEVRAIACRALLAREPLGPAQEISRDCSRPHCCRSISSSSRGRSMPRPRSAVGARKR